MNDEQINETTLRDYVRVLFRHKGVILITILTVCLVVFVGLKLKTKQYESSVKLLIAAEKQVESMYYREMYGSQNIQQTLTQSEIVKSNHVLGRVVRALKLNKRPIDDEKKFASHLKGKLIDYQNKGLEKKLNDFTKEQRDGFFFRRAVESLKNNISVVPIRDTNMFIIRVKDYNPVASTVIANVVSRSYIIFDLEQQLAELRLKYAERHPTVNLLETSIKELKKTLSGAPVDAIKAIGPASVKIIEQAVIPLEATGTSKMLTFLLAIVMSGFLAVMLSFVFEYTDQTLKSIQEVERFLNLPIVGTIPRRGLGQRLLIRNAKNKSTYGRHYQSLSDQLYLLGKDKNLKSILFTSAGPKEGAAATAANVGKYLADKAGHRVLLIDADFRNPILNKLLNVDKNVPGLSYVLEGKTPSKDPVHKISKNLHIITAGTTEFNPVILLDSSRLVDIMREARDNYEIVLVNCPNLKGHKDALVLSSHVDTTVVVINEGETRRQVVKAAVSQLKKKESDVLGAILNNRTFPIPGFVYHWL